MTPIEQSDAEKIAAMARRIWPVVYAGIIAREQINFMLDWMYSPQKIQDDMGNGVRFFWIEQETQITGFAAFGPVRENGDCEIHKLYILPEYHRRGIGMNTLQEIAEFAAETGASALHLRVNRHNRAAIALYQKAGFSIVKEDIQEIGNGFVMDDFIFQKQISAASG